MTRLAYIHTGAVVIPTFATLSAQLLPGIEVQHLLDSMIVADLRRDAAGAHIEERLTALGAAAVEAGASTVVISCSSIGGFAAGLSERLGVPVLRIDEAMADEAVAAGGRVAVVATLATTLVPTVALLHERAGLAGVEIDVTDRVIEGAFEAVSAGDAATHDRLVGEAIVEIAAESDVVVLAQASMAGAASAVSVEVPVLTSPELGVRRVAQLVGAG
jgi:aspartate/glutamate racemase